MSEDFPIKIELGPALKLFLRSQLFRTPSYPTHSFAQQTVFVTGANIGLGLEAARHFYRLNCAKLILAVRSVTKGQTAKEVILKSVTHRTDADAIEVWPLDLSSTASTVAFAERVNKELPRVDAVVENAGINSKIQTVSEGIEQTMQVNVINTFLLALLLLPKLRETKATFADSQPHLTIVTSEAHHLTKFEQLNAPDIYESLNDKKLYNGQGSYEISKLVQILFTRELVSRINASNFPSPSVTINLVNPGLCVSTLSARNEKPLGARVFEWLICAVLARTTEVGSRTLVLGACAGPASHGVYMSDGHSQVVEPWIYEDVGKRAQKKVFEQTMKIIEKRKPGLGAAIGL